MTALRLEKEIMACLKVDRQGALVSLTELAKRVSASTPEVYRTSCNLAKKGMVRIITRYWCPEFHPLNLDFSQETLYVLCESCELEYDTTDILVGIYIQVIDIDLIYD